MFQAFIVVCAINLSQQIDTTRCTRLDDAWGPYKTEEHCKIRTNQMSYEVVKGQLNPLISHMLGNPPVLNVEQHCIQTGTSA
jgi:hypothetical protein